MIRIYALLSALMLIAGCATQSLDGPPAPLGDFSLGHNVVIASKAVKGPVSRTASEDELAATLKTALADRFERYEGEQLYHFGVSVEGYMLAPRGVPLVYTPKSALVVNVTVWDDAGGRKLNEKPHQLTILETTDQNSVFIGSGWGRSKNKQLNGLSYNAARAIELWLLEQREEYGWFGEDERVMTAADAIKKPVDAADR